MRVDGGLIQVVCPMAGVVLRVERGAGSQVGEEEPLVTVEVDGTRMVVRAGVRGVLREVQAEVGTEVAPGDVLAHIEPDDKAVLADADPADPAGDARRKEQRCTQCGSTELEDGFLTDRGQGSFSQWVAGRLETGLLGGPRLRGRRRCTIEASRCVLCGHLELYAIAPRE